MQYTVHPAPNKESLAWGMQKKAPDAGQSLLYPLKRFLTFFPALPVTAKCTEYPWRRGIYENTLGFHFFHRWKIPLGLLGPAFLVCWKCWKIGKLCDEQIFLQFLDTAFKSCTYQIMRHMEQEKTIRSALILLSVGKKFPKWGCRSLHDSANLPGDADVPGKMKDSWSAQPKG